MPFADYIEGPTTDSEYLLPVPSSTRLTSGSHIKWANLPKAPSGSAGSGWPKYPKRGGMKYALIDNGDETDITDMRSTAPVPSSIVGAVLALFGDDGSSKSKHDASTDEQHTTNHELNSVNAPHDDDDRHSDSDSGATDDDDDDNEEANERSWIPECLSSAAIALGSKAREAHIQLSKEITRRAPPAEDPLDPHSSCCWAAFHTVCLDTGEEDVSEEMEIHQLRAQSAGLTLRNKLAPLDDEGCEDHCCQESRYFNSIKSVRTPTCHG